MNGDRRDRDRNEQPCDPQRGQSAGRGAPDLTALASRIQELNQRAAREYAPLVEDLLRSGSRDVRRIEQTLDGLLDFCGYDPVLMLYRRLCRHYWDIDPAAAARYVRFYREMWDSASLSDRSHPHE